MAPTRSRGLRVLCGFTLVEVLVALLIVAGASAAILGYLRSLLQYQERFGAQQTVTSRLLNQVAMLHLGSLTGARLEYVGADARLVPPDSSSPALTLSNFSIEGKRVPPVEIAYTPWQVYTLTEAQRTLPLLMTGLPPPRIIDSAQLEQARAAAEAKREGGGAPPAALPAREAAPAPEKAKTP